MGTLVSDTNCGVTLKISWGEYLYSWLWCGGNVSEYYVETTFTFAYWGWLVDDFYEEAPKYLLAFKNFFEGIPKNLLACWEIMLMGFSLSSFFSKDMLVIEGDLKYLQRIEDAPLSLYTTTILLNICEVIFIKDQSWSYWWLLLLMSSTVITYNATLALKYPKSWTSYLKNNWLLTVNARRQKMWL